MNHPPIRPIVCGTDFSEPSTQAANFAAAIARPVLVAPRHSS
jgi:hypothetical protein